MISTADHKQTINCLVSWLEIRSQAGHEFPSSVEELLEAIEHSALLGRLLEGKAPEVNPPPLSFGQPWYELSEHGFAACDVSIEAGGLRINGTLWEVVANCRGGTYFVRPANKQGVYLVWEVLPLSAENDAETRWMIERFRGVV